MLDCVVVVVVVVCKHVRSDTFPIALALVSSARSRLKFAWKRKLTF